MPLLSPIELQELADDIEKNGLQHRVAIYTDGEVEYLLDGRNRLDALQLLGVSIFNESGRREPEYFEDVDQVWPPVPRSDFDPFTYVISTNIRRRHLTADQKRDVIAKLLKAKPEQSNRQIGKLVGRDHKTVATVRTDLEGRGEIPHVATVKDTAGRQQPAKKPTKEIVTSKPTSTVASAATTASTLKAMDDFESSIREFLLVLIDFSKVKVPQIPAGHASLLLDEIDVAIETFRDTFREKIAGLAAGGVIDGGDE